jgi:hypothetical protein
MYIEYEESDQISQEVYVLIDFANEKVKPLSRPYLNDELENAILEIVRQKKQEALRPRVSDEKVSSAVNKPNTIARKD